MYHEPVLCSALDGKMLHPSYFADKWFTHIFARNLEISKLIAFWEFCLEDENPTLPYFFGLVIVSRAREKILSRRNLSGKDTDLFKFYIDKEEELDELCQEALGL